MYLFGPVWPSGKAIHPLAADIQKKKSSSNRELKTRNSSIYLRHRRKHKINRKSTKEFYLRRLHRSSIVHRRRSQFSTIAWFIRRSHAFKRAIKHLAIELKNISFNLRILRIYESYSSFIFISVHFSQYRRLIRQKLRIASTKLFLRNISKTLRQSQFINSTISRCRILFSVISIF